MVVECMLHCLGHSVRSCCPRSRSDSRTTPVSLTAPLNYSKKIAKTGFQKLPNFSVFNVRFGVCVNPVFGSDVRMCLTLTASGLECTMFPVDKRLAYWSADYCYVGCGAVVLVRFAYGRFDMGTDLRDFSDSPFRECVCFPTFYSFLLKILLLIFQVCMEVVVVLGGGSGLGSEGVFLCYFRYVCVCLLTVPASSVSKVPLP